jgi:hypothetical protein
MNFTEAYVCNIGRTHDLSKRINKRVYASEKLPVSFDPRPVATNRVHFPMLDARKKSSVTLENRGFFDSSRVFSPGNLAPFNGYMKSIDDESKLKNIIFPMQKGIQSKFIPSSNSDLYNNEKYVAGRKEYNPYTGLFHQENFNPVIPCNTNQIGFETFHNHTRQQTKNLK